MPEDLNLTISGFQQQPFIPSEACFDWCKVQHVVHSNNIEIWTVFIVFVAYLFILLYSAAEEIEFLKKYQFHFIYFAKLFLIFFFGMYILVIRLQVF